MPTGPGPVWQRNLAVLSAAQAVTIAAMGVVIPLIPFFLRELGMTDPAALERWSGLTFSGPFLVASAISPVWGWLGDRFGHKKMVVRAILGLALVNFLLVFVRTPLQFALIRFAQGAVTGFVPAALAITTASAPRALLPAAVGRLSASSAAGRMLGPALGGLLAGFLAFRQLFLLVGLTIGVAAVFVIRFLEEPPRERGRTTTSLAGPLRAVLADRSLRAAMPGLLLAAAATSMTMPLFPLYVEGLDRLEADPKVVTGIGFGVVAGSTLLASTWLGRLADRFGLKALLVAGLGLAAVALVAHPLVEGVVPMLGLRALLGVASAGVAPVLHAMIGRAAPGGLGGGVTGLANSAQILGFFIGPVAGGFLANAVGIDGVFRVAAGLALACAVGAAIVARRVGRDRAIPPVPREVPR